MSCGRAEAGEPCGEGCAVWRDWWAGPTATAAMLTLLNAVKPAVVDDTAYLLFARHIAAHPLDPYGFELFWYDRPQPAMEVLAPPVVPYWLAGGIALFGEHLFLLKLWLFPFALILCLSALWLLRRFARGTERVGVVMLVFSPAVLPLFNFMLDVPAVALGLAAVAVFARACNRGSWQLAVAAGLLAGVAAQTKYTMMTVPAVIVLYGVLHQRIRLAAAAGLAGVAVFAAWEASLEATYGVSHFLRHARNQQADGAGFAALLAAKAGLVNPLLGFLGALGAGWGLYAGRAVGFGGRLVVVVAAVAAVGYMAVCLIPYSDSVLLRSRTTGSPRLDLPAVVFYPTGAAALVTVTASAAILTFRHPRPGPVLQMRRDPAAWFLAGWLVIELAGYFVLTPFPAARRVIMISVILALIACRLVSRLGRLRPDRKPGRWVVWYSVALGIGLFALDTWDALPERQLAHRTSDAIGERGGGQIWTQGHWGWQYYTDRLGMRLVVPDQTKLRIGDWLVVPEPPDEVGFYRPYHGGATFQLDRASVERVTEFVWDDLIAGQTIPNLYGGVVPVHGRDHPRLRVAVYRVTRDWVPARNETP
jgi:hypothetical protein